MKQFQKHELLLTENYILQVKYLIFFLVPITRTIKKQLRKQILIQILYKQNTKKSLNDIIF